VEKATKMNPTVVFPNPVMSAILTEFVIVTSLALPRATSDAKRIRALPNRPHSSNNASYAPFRLIQFRTVLKVFSRFAQKRDKAKIV